MDVHIRIYGYYIHVTLARRLVYVIYIVYVFIMYNIILCNNITVATTGIKIIIVIIIVNGNLCLRIMFFVVNYSLERLNRRSALILYSDTGASYLYWVGTRVIMIISYTCKRLFIFISDAR